MEFNKNDVVMIIGTDSVPSQYLGTFGIVTGIYGDRCMVLCNAPIRSTGSMSHTVLKTELQKIGQSDFNFNN